MSMKYDEASFWAGVTVGSQLHGKGAYGVMPGWNPEGDLILRPITQGIGRIHFKTEERFAIRAFTDILEPVFPVHEGPVFIETMGRIPMRDTHTFTIRPINERLGQYTVIKAYSIDETINPLEYDDTIVYINSSGAFTMDEMSRTFTSTEQSIDIGTLQEVTVTVDEFAEVTAQEVTT